MAAFSAVGAGFCGVCGKPGNRAMTA